MKTSIEQTNSHEAATNPSASMNLPPISVNSRIHFPSAIRTWMVGAILLLDAVLPLRDLWFHEALLTQLGWWPVLPTLILFPGQQVIPPVPFFPSNETPSLLLSWLEVPLLLVAFLVVFAIYLVALRRLPGLINRRYILQSTLLLGMLLILFPIVTSQDVYSYIAYARMGTIYHLNPLTTLPTAISSDRSYDYLFWTDQPSAYGPTWAIITGVLQWPLSFLPPTFILPMLLVLRLLGLATHLGSTLLIWSISGYLQRYTGFISSQKQVLATLAFAWNPLLLFEACVNAHNDAVLLFFLLLAMWFLVRGKALHRPGSVLPDPVGTGVERSGAGTLASPLREEGQGAPNLRSTLLAFAALALATCLKINIVLLMPGLLLYIWMQRGPVTLKVKRLLATSATYAGIIVLLYAPFWQGGAVLDLFQVNPATYRDINSLPEFLSYLYNSISSLFTHHIAPQIGSPAEHLSHTLAIGIFGILYLLLCWQALRRGEHIRTLPGLLRWLAIAWLLYCAIGSTWFWPWYLVTFFGLYALIEACSDEDSNPLHQGLSFGAFTIPLSPRVLAFSMLSLYCFFTWGFTHSFIPGLPGFEWTYLRSLWAWLLPLIAVYIHGKQKRGLGTCPSRQRTASYAARQAR